ncbi:hypothetical protein KM043_012065 [Ampulex compressa]|nr:hypothetical protein KM043_012065 [Ampulex compressa]
MREGARRKRASLKGSPLLPLKVTPFMVHLSSRELQEIHPAPLHRASKARTPALSPFGRVKNFHGSPVDPPASKGRSSSNGRRGVFSMEKSGKKRMIHRESMEEQPRHSLVDPAGISSRDPTEENAPQSRAARKVGDARRIKYAVYGSRPRRVMNAEQVDAESPR